MTTVVRVEQSTPIRFRAFLDFEINPTNIVSENGFSYANGKHLWNATYKIDRLRVWTYGPGSGFFERDLIVPTDHKLNLRFALSRTLLEMGIHRGSYPWYPEPHIGFPRFDDVFDPLHPYVLQSRVYPQAQVADPPTITPSGRSSLVTYGVNRDLMGGGQAGFEIENNGDSLDQILFRSTVSMSDSKWNALHAYMSNPPSGVSGMFWPVDWIRIPTLLER